VIDSTLALLDSAPAAPGEDALPGLPELTWRLVDRAGCSCWGAMAYQLRLMPTSDLAAAQAALARATRAAGDGRLRAARARVLAGPEAAAWRQARQRQRALAEEAARARAEGERARQDAAAAVRAGADPNAMRAAARAALARAEDLEGDGAVLADVVAEKAAALRAALAAARQAERDRIQALATEQLPRTEAVMVAAGQLAMRHLALRALLLDLAAAPADDELPEE
jgi:hypothetical protein